MAPNLLIRGGAIALAIRDKRALALGDAGDEELGAVLRVQGVLDGDSRCSRVGVHALKGKGLQKTLMDPLMILSENSAWKSFG